MENGKRIMDNYSENPDNVVFLKIIHFPFSIFRYV